MLIPERVSGEGEEDTGLRMGVDCCRTGILSMKYRYTALMRFDSQSCMLAIVGRSTGISRVVGSTEIGCILGTAVYPVGRIGIGFQNTRRAHVLKPPRR